MNLAAKQLMVEVLESELTQDLGMPPDEQEHQRKEIDDLRRDIDALGDNQGFEG